MTSALVDRVFERASSITPNSDPMFRTSDPVLPGLESRRVPSPTRYHDVEAGSTRRGTPGVYTAAFTNTPRNTLRALWRHYEENRNRAFSVELSRPDQRTVQVVYDRPPQIDVGNRWGTATAVLRDTLTAPDPRD